MQLSRATARAATRAASLQLALSAIALAIPSVSTAQLVLAPTTVTATRFPEPSQSLTFGVSVITREEIERSGAATVNEALMRVLGIVGRQDFFGGGEYNIDLRGFGSTADTNQVIVVDGLRLSEADLGGTRLAGIPIESVERIEVLRGSGAVLYGEGATGGVIIITTRAGTGKDRPNGASLYGAAGSYRLREARANANVGANGFSLDASLQKRDSDNHRDNFRSKQDAQSVTGQWGSDNYRLGVRHVRDALDTRLPGALSAAQYAANPRQSTTPDDHAEIRGARTSIFGEAQFETWQFGIDAGTRDKQLRSMNAGFAYDYDVQASNYSLRVRNDSRSAGVRNLLLAGFDHDRWSRDVFGAFGSAARQTSSAWYVKDDVVLPSATRLSFGYRTQKLEKTASSTPAGIDDRVNAWELGASQPLGAGVTAYARIGRSFRLANVDEFSFTATGAGLLPQTSRDVEAGARWADAKSSVDARVYRNALTHEIGFDPAAGPFGFGANVNFDPTKRQGVEIDAAHALTSTLGLRLNAGVRKASFRAGPYAGRDVPLVPRRTVALRADWAVAEGHRVSGGVNWVSSQHPDFANACAMPSYTVADVRYAYTWRAAELSLGVNNLADRKYYTQAFRCASGAPSAIYPEAGRAVTAALRVKF